MHHCSCWLVPLVATTHLPWTLALVTPARRPCLLARRATAAGQLHASISSRAWVVAAPRLFGDVPDERVLSALDKAPPGGFATAADVSSASGLPLDQAKAELVQLAALLASDGATEMAVDTDGEVAFAFPRDVAGAVRRQSRLARWRGRWERLKVRS